MFQERKKREEGRQAPELEPEPGNRTPFPEKRKKKEEGRQAPAPEPEPPGTRKSWWNRTPFWRKEKREEKGNKHLNTSRNQKNQDIMMEQNPFPKKRKKREEGRQAPEPQPEPGKTTKSLLRKARRKQKGDKPRNQSRNQQEAGNHDGTASFFEQRKKTQEGRQEGRQAPEPKREPARNRKSWWNSLLFWTRPRGRPDPFPWKMRREVTQIGGVWSGAVLALFRCAESCTVDSYRCATSGSFGTPFTFLFLERLYFFGVWMLCSDGCASFRGNTVVTVASPPRVSRFRQRLWFPKNNSGLRGKSLLAELVRLSRGRLQAPSHLQAWLTHSFFPTHPTSHFWLTH